MNSLTSALIGGGLFLLFLALLSIMRGKTTTGGAQVVEKRSLFQRLGGIYGIAAVVDRFSDKLIVNALVGKTSNNPQLREWALKSESRLPGLKFQRTLWVAEVTGGPYTFRPTVAVCPFSNTSVTGNNADADCRLNLTQAHCPFRISSDEFDEVARELASALDFYKVPQAEMSEVLNAFAAHKNQVIFCSLDGSKE